MIMKELNNYEYIHKVITQKDVEEDSTHFTKSTASPGWCKPDVSRE